MCTVRECIAQSEICERILRNRISWGEGDDMSSGRCSSIQHPFLDTRIRVCLHVLSRVNLNSKLNLKLDGWSPHGSEEKTFQSSDLSRPFRLRSKLDPIRAKRQRIMH